MDDTLAQLGGFRRWLVAFLISLALLSGQVTVTRLLSYPLFYHFVFLVISLAQLGLAAAGAWIYASGRTSWSRGELAGWLGGVSLASLAVLGAYAWAMPEPTLSFAKLSGIPAYLYLAQIALLLVAFNFCGGMALTMLFTTFKEQIGRLYSADLLGAGLGCVAAVGLMMTLGPVRAFVVSGAAAGVAAATVLFEGKRPAPGRVALAAILVALGAAFAWPEAFDPNVARPATRERILRSEWNHIARTDALEPGRYRIDGDALTDVTSEGKTPLAPEYELLGDHPAVAIVGVGAGPQLAVAISREASSVLAVDINPTILRWSQEEDREFNRDLFHWPEVTVVAGEGRQVLRSTPAEFDLVVMHAIDTWTASSQGAYALTENFLYTREAMQDLLSKLTEEGVVSIRRWLFWPPRENMRLFTTVHEALAGMGFAEPERHLVVLSPTADYRKPDLKVSGFLLFSRSPFSAERLARLDAYAAQRGMVYLHRPGRELDTPFSAFAAAADRDAFYRDYPYVVTPARDDNPFFFQFVMPWSAAGMAGRYDRALYSQSSNMLVFCLVICTVLAAVLLGLPALRRRRELRAEPQSNASLVYFACLGVGFLAFELPTIQIMTLFLGHPTYALSVVLLGLLVAAGIGSSLMGRRSISTGRAAMLTIALLGVICSQALLPAVHAMIPLPLPLRVAITLALLALLGIPLGMPFVAGIRALDPNRPAQVAWAWGVNGAAAVVGSAVLMIVMVYFGSDATFGVAAACYLAAFAAHRRLDRQFIDESGPPAFSVITTSSTAGE